MVINVYIDFDWGSKINKGGLIITKYQFQNPIKKFKGKFYT
jgi:hypothetical protein